MMTQSPGKPIFGTGNHFEWGENQILKLYGPGVPRDFIKELGRREKKLFESGFPVPEVGELIEFEDSLGQVYERIEGKSIGEELQEITDASSGRVVELAHEFAEAHAKTHSLRDIQAEMPQQKEFFPTILHRIDVLPSDLRDATLKALKAMPDGDRICHGDYHPWNVLLSSRGPIIIDWNNSHIGNPIEDVARSKVILTGFSRMEPSVSDVVDRFNQFYLERYFRLRPDGQEQIEAWWPIVSAVRLIDGIPEIQDWLLGQIRMSFSK